MHRAASSLVAAGLVLAAIGCGQPDDPPATSPDSSATTATTTGPALPIPTGFATPPAPVPTDDASATSDAGRTLTVADDGEVIVLAVDEQVEVIQSDPLSPDPTVTGDVVELVEFVNVTGSGQREWEVRATTPGTTRLSVPDGGTAFQVTIEVR